MGQFWLQAASLDSNFVWRHNERNILITSPVIGDSIAENWKQVEQSQWVYLITSFFLNTKPEVVYRGRRNYPPPPPPPLLRTLEQKKLPRWVNVHNTFTFFVYSKELYLSNFGHPTSFNLIFLILFQYKVSCVVTNTESGFNLLSDQFRFAVK